VYLMTAALYPDRLLHLKYTTRNIKTTIGG
jgi:hypothetical protein